MFTNTDILYVLYNGLFKVNLEMAILGCDLENEIPVYVRNWELKTWVLKSRFENPDSWLLSKKAIINFIHQDLTPEPCRKPKANNQ